MVIKEDYQSFFDKKSASLKKSSGSGIVNEPNYKLANELHEKKKSLFIFQRQYLANMKSLSKYNKGNKYLLCAIDLFSKYAWVIPIKDKKDTSIVNAF